MELKSFLKFTIILIILYFPQIIKANILLVPQQYSTIQSAINVSVTNDTVLISPGVYYENINFRGKSIVVKGNNLSGPVVIDGSQPVSPDSASVVTFCLDATGSPVIDGLTITGGTGTKTSNGKIGGGIFISDASPIIKNCIVQQNSASLGGGIGQWGETNPNISINYCIFSNNSAGKYGGGIWLYRCTGNIYNCTIISNFAINGSNLTLTNSSEYVQVRNTIIWFGTLDAPSNEYLDNIGYCDIQSGWPTGFTNISKDPMFCNYNSSDFHISYYSPCLRSGVNGTTIGALGVCTDQTTIFDYPLSIGTTWIYKHYLGAWESVDDPFYIYNGIYSWTIVDSVSESNRTRFKCRVIENDTEVWHNGVTIYNCDTSFSYIDRTPSSIIINSYQDTLQGVFSGSDSLVFQWGIIGDARYAKNVYKEKIGLLSTYSFWHGNTTQIEYMELLSLNGVTVNVVDEISTMPKGFNLQQNYPNPFNPNTTIEYSIPAVLNVTLKVYDLLGREVTTLVNKEQLAGSYKVNFNATGLASGVYLYRLTAGKYSKANKLILLK
ncbi:MAG: T9SS type A sorting domain-containing protein [Ignavibacteriaceae bacterium]|nr:T9SS type A sorting domain-containing protein [Ignavibacteriaceae bacterium]